MAIKVDELETIKLLKKDLPMYRTPGGTFPP